MTSINLEDILPEGHMAWVTMIHVQHCCTFHHIPLATTDKILASV